MLKITKVFPAKSLFVHSCLFSEKTNLSVLLNLPNLINTKTAPFSESPKGSRSIILSHCKICMVEISDDMVPESTLNSLFQNADLFLLHAILLTGPCPAGERKKCKNHPLVQFSFGLYMFPTKQKDAASRAFFPPPRIF